MAFDQLCSFRIRYLPVTVRKWRSSRTGLQLTWLDRPSPFISCYISVRTETPDDTGRLHALDKMIQKQDDLETFLFKGSCYGEFDRDFYRYYVSAVGWESFKRLLPGSLDKVLKPNLDDFEFATKVYSIGVDGKPTGVAYREVKATEAQPWTADAIASSRILYKGTGLGHSAWGVSTEMAKLEPEQLRNFHAQFFHADNMGILVSGTVDEAELLSLVTKYDDTLPAMQPGFRRPLSRCRTLPLKEPVCETVKYPTATSNAPTYVSINWVGPDGRDYVLSEAGETMAEYVNAAFGEPCHIAFKHYQKTGLSFQFRCDTAEDAQTLPERFLNFVDEQILDIPTLRQIVRQRRRKFIRESESCSSPVEGIMRTALYEFSYGDNDGSDLKSWLKRLDRFDILLEWELSDWIQAYKMCFWISRPAIISMQPKEQSEEPTSRKTSASIKRISGLMVKLCKIKVVDIEERLKWFEPPKPANLSFVHSKTINRHDLPQIHMEHISSHFVCVSLFLSVFELGQQHLPYVPVIIRMLSEFPDDNDSIEYNARCCNQEFIKLTLRCPASKYRRTINRLFQLIFIDSFSKEKTLAVLSQLAELPAEDSLPHRVLYTSRSLRLVRDSQTQFAKGLLKRANEGHFSVVAKDLEAARKHLFNLSNIRVAVVFDKYRVDRVAVPWKDFRKPELKFSRPLTDFSTIPRKVVRVDLSEERLELAGRYFIKAQNSADRRSLEVHSFLLGFDPFKWEFALKCLNEQGDAAYHLDVETGLLSVKRKLAEASEPETRMELAGCFAFAKKTLEDLVRGLRVVNKKQRLTVTSKMVLEEASRQSNLHDAAMEKIMDVLLRGRGEYYGERMINAVAKITTQDLIAVFKECLTRLFSPHYSICILSCEDMERAGLSHYFEDLGYSA